MWRRLLVSRLPYGGRRHALELLLEQLNLSRQPVQLLLLLIDNLVQLLDGILLVHQVDFQIGDPLFRHSALLYNALQSK
jgi:hypothetical protein